MWFYIVTLATSTFSSVNMIENNNVNKMKRMFHPKKNKKNNSITKEGEKSICLLFMPNFLLSRLTGEIQNNTCRFLFIVIKGPLLNSYNTHSRYRNFHGGDSTNLCQKYENISLL